MFHVEHEDADSILLARCASREIDLIATIVPRGTIGLLVGATMPCHALAICDERLAKEGRATPPVAEMFHVEHPVRVSLHHLLRLVGVWMDIAESRWFLQVVVSGESGALE